MDDRRQLIANAALAVVGDRGVRALTHHAVDDEAGLARGSTSYYCRRRVDLLRAAGHRLYELDRADIAAMVESIAPEQRADRAAINDAIAELLVQWLTPPLRRRSVARIELFMAASHEPELQTELGDQFAGLGEVVRPLGGSPLDARAAGVAARFLLADGLMLRVLRQGLAAPEHAEIVALLAQVGD